MDDRPRYDGVARFLIFSGVQADKRDGFGCGIRVKRNGNLQSLKENGASVEIACLYEIVFGKKMEELKAGHFIP
jgi:hypothetical protein